MDATLYARFSERPDAAECESILTQRERMQQYCKFHGWTVANSFEDRAASGGSMKGRPGLAAALDAVCEVKGVLVVYSLSRLARSTRDAIKIMERLGSAGAELASLHEKLDTTSAMGRFIFRMMASLAELEREQTQERTSDGMQRRQADGQRMSRHPPAGKMLDPNDPTRLIDNPEEQKTVALIQQCAASGQGSHRIAKTLAELGVQFRGKPIHRSAVERVMARIAG